MTQGKSGGWAASGRLLNADEGFPAIVVNPAAASPILLIADHMGRQVPAALKDLELSSEALQRHIAWDIGVAGMGERLAHRLGATLIGQRYSRLVIDCNRDPARPDAIPQVSDGVAIPGNLELSAADRSRRVEEIFNPYHRAIASDLDARRGRPCVLVALHSFTPQMGGFRRPWRYGVLHDHPSPLSRALLARLRQDAGEDLVGDNQPYAMDGVDFSVPNHAVARGLDYAEIEVRQDLIATEEGQAEVAEWLAPRLLAALARAQDEG